jgi:hypothetical protein
MEEGYLQTGQRTCHDAAGHEIPCAGSGQEGELRKGIRWPVPRSVSKDKTVLDRLTGLTWSQNANLAEFPMSWQEVLEYVAVMNREKALGHGDWRLPNRRELRSLICHQSTRPALPEDHPFCNVYSGWYWTSTTAAIHPGYAWYVHTEGGRMFYGQKRQFYLVWPVRGAGFGVLPATGQNSVLRQRRALFRAAIQGRTASSAWGGHGRSLVLKLQATPLSTALHIFAGYEGRT